MADIMKYWTTQVDALIEATGAVIIVLAAIEAALRAVTVFVRRGFPAEAKVAVWLRLAVFGPAIRTMKGARDTPTTGLSEPSALGHAEPSGANSIHR
jgi:hypothetical protein